MVEEFNEDTEITESDRLQFLTLPVLVTFNVNNNRITEPDSAHSDHKHDKLQRIECLPVTDTREEELAMDFARAENTSRRYLDLILEANKRTNLTRITSREEAEVLGRRHAELCG